VNLGRAEVWILAASLAAAGYWFTRPPGVTPREQHGQPERAAPALAALPAGAAFAVNVRMTPLRQSTVGRMLTGSGRDLPGLGPIASLCGFDPTERIDELALGVARERPGEEPSFGIVASGHFEADAVLGCAAKVLAKRGGEPQKSRIGSFVSVRDRSRSGPEIAVRDGGPVLVGEGPYFRAMLDAAEGEGPNLLGDEAHATLRQSVRGHGLLTATWLSRPGWLARFADVDDAEQAPLGKVRAGAFRLQLEPEPRAELVLACPGESDCQSLSTWVERARGDLSKGLLGELGIDPIRVAQIRREESAVRATVELDSAKLEKLALRLLLDETPSKAPPTATAFEPDEVLKPPRDAQGSR